MGKKRGMEIKQKQIIENQVIGKISNQIECDEIRSFVQNKATKCWIWLAICKAIKLILGFVTGSRGKKTCGMFYEKISKFTNSNTVFYTDWCEAYLSSIPKDQHKQGKDQTYTIEGYDSNFRDDLQRLTRRTKAYSKSQEYLEASLYLYIASHNEKKLKLLNYTIG
jgi:insertion element IS1 protein InsB